MTEVSARKTTNRGQSWTIIGGIDDNYELQFFEEDNIGYSAGTVLKINKAEGNFNIWNRLILNDTFSDVYFTSETTGYVASRWFYKTTDSGISWIMLPNFPTNLFTSTLGSVAFTDNVTGFVGGPPCRIVKTTDAGETWYVANRTGLTDTIGTINKILFINPTTGWAVTSRGGILKTQDGGDNWFAQLNASVSVVFNSLYFVNSLYGWTANESQWPFKTTDGGASWVQQVGLNIFATRDIFFIDSLTGFTIKILELYKTTNSGNIWFIQLNSQYVLRNFGWLSNNHGLIVGDGVYETIDSGNTWNEILELRNNGLRKFHSPKDYIGFSVGNLGLIYEYIDTTIIPVELYSFYSEVFSNTVTLKWSTSSEKNNSGFEILRSVNKENWDKLGFIDGNGTSTQINYYKFTDQIETYGTYYYKLKQIDFSGDFYYSNIIEVKIVNPFSFELFQNFPNPFNSSTTIRYQLPKDNFVSLKVYDVLGNEVKTILSENKKAGYYSISFNTNNLSSGIYFYKLTAGENSSTRKFILLK